MATNNQRKTGKMSLEEAGRKGGETRTEKYSEKDLSQQPKKGAQNLEGERSGFHSEIGKKGGQKGGETRAKDYSHEDRSKQAQKGAQTVERERPGFHSEIGKKGGETRGKK